MARTDIYAWGAAQQSGMRSSSQSNRPIWVSAGTWYCVFIDAASADIAWIKTTDYGVTWTTPAVIKVGSMMGVGVWFDKWTPGDSGTVIHIAYIESAGGHDVLYRALDTSTDTLGSEITVFDGASAVTGAATCLSITKSRGNRILVAFDIDGGTETGFAKSNDFPVTAFTAKTDVNEATSDYYILLPGNYSDSNDIDAIYWDRSADELTLKTYDDSANNWTGVSAETSIAGSMTDLASSSAAPMFAAGVRNSDGHAMLAAWSASDTANADLRFWDINGASSITEKTNVVLNSTDDQGMCAVGIDSTSDKIYVFYGGKSDGSETAYTALNIYYKTSTDGGATWSAETKLSNLTRPYSFLFTSLEFGVADEFVTVYGGIQALNATAIELWCSALPQSSGGSGGQRVFGGG